jgi:adenine-specific DNA-methyltransferase
MPRNPDRRDRARGLRRNTAPAEAILWKQLRNRRFAGFKFRRQHPIGPFFADLACQECRLIVELDGETHLGREAEDAARTRYLQDREWLVVRFWNTEVYNDLETVLEAIYQLCQERKPPSPSPPTPLPRSGGEGSR